jgi:hypothetical protein
MSIVRVGATKQYSDNWENIFSGGRRKASTKKATAAPARKSAKKSGKVTAKADARKRAANARRKSK